VLGASTPGATWPDVALEAVQFAENSPGTFVLVVGFLIFLTVTAIFLVWLMMPRAAVHMERIYQTIRNRAKQEAKDLFHNNDGTS
jgi:hypothetical protein